MLSAEGKGPGTLSSWGTGEGTVSRFTVLDIRGVDAHSSAKRGRSCVRGEGRGYHSFHHTRATVRSQYLPPGLEHHRQQGRRRGRTAGSAAEGVYKIGPVRRGIALLHVAGSNRRERSTDETSPASSAVRGLT